ncbi:MAG: type II toxin-antitoxin system RelB/DinJ family antitoxin [Clostridiales bacterium]|nr:type II toxin-antitoxin system RelB/DinJ family antitoxin [Clostridiales bacterium]
MAKTASIYARIEPNLKEQAEYILNELGIPMSNAISMFLKQIVLQKGIPFEMKLPKNKPLNFNSLSEDEFNKIIEKGFKDYEDGDVISAENVALKMKRKYGI